MQNIEGMKKEKEAGERKREKEIRRNRQATIYHGTEQAFS